MQNRLPLTIDPIKAAQKRLDYTGVYPSARFERLVSSIEALNNDVTCSLSFYFDAQRLCVIAIVAECELVLRCERCQNQFTKIIRVENKFSPVKNDVQAEALPEHYEPVLTNEFGEVDVLALVEDELILALPIVPVHDSTHCEVSEANWIFGEIPEEDEKPNPFAILASLKNKE